MWADCFIIKTSPVNDNKINHHHLPSHFSTVLKPEKYNLCCALHKANYHIIFHENIKILDETNKKSIFFFKHGRLKVGGATVFNDNLDVIEFYMFNS